MGAADEEEIAALKARLAALQATQDLAHPKTTATRRPMRTRDKFLLIVAAVIGAAILVNQAPNMTAGTPAKYESPYSAAQQARILLREKVKSGPLTRAEQRRAEALLWEGYPRAGAKASQVQTFYFNGDPTMCGTVGTVRVGTARRFIVKHGAVLIEGDVSPRDFDLLWQICDAAP